MSEFINMKTGYSVPNDKNFWMAMRNNDNYAKEKSDRVAKGLLAWTAIYSPVTGPTVNPVRIWTPSFQAEPGRNYMFGMYGIKAKTTPAATPIVFALSLFLNTSVVAYATSLQRTFEGYGEFGPLTTEFHWNSTYMSVTQSGQIGAAVDVSPNGGATPFTLDATDSSPIIMVIVDKGLDHGF